MTGYCVVLLCCLPAQLILSAGRIGLLRDVVLRTPIGTHSYVGTFRRYASLKHLIDQDDVVMAPMEDSWVLPAIIGCKVVGVSHANPFMTDFAERRSATERFFTEQSALSGKWHTLSRYSVHYLLVPNSYHAHVFNMTQHMPRVKSEREYALYQVQ